MSLLAVLAAATAVAGGVDREAVRSAVAEAGFPRVADAAAAAARPRVNATSVRIPLPRRLGTSRIGGPPDLPTGERWPRCRGERLSFVAQVRLADLPREARVLRRLRGHLLVFTQIEFEGGSEGDPGSANDGGRCTRVMHVRPGQGLRRRAFPKGTLRSRPAALRFRTRSDVPDADYDAGRLGPPLRDAPFDGERWFEWSEMRAALTGTLRGPGHRLLGHPSTPNGTVDPCWQRTQRAARPWRHLLTAGYDEAARFMVGDGGSLEVHIAAGDLRRGRFDRVCSHVDQ